MLVSWIVESSQYITSRVSQHKGKDTLQHVDQLKVQRVVQAILEAYLTEVVHSIKTNIIIWKQEIH